MAKTDTPAVAKLLREFAQRSALRGGNPYRAKAYSRAADALAALAEPLEDLIAQDRLQEIPGVGAAIADIITKMHRTGSHPGLESMRKEIPEGVLEMLAVPGLRPDKILKLYQALGITSLDALEQAAKDDRIKANKGLGASLQTKILNNIGLARSGEFRLHMHRADALLKNAVKTLERAQPDLERITVAGDLRRGAELVGDLALVAETKTLEDGPAALKTSGALTVHFTDRKHYGATLLAATGSEGHLTALRELAKGKGLRLDERGLWRGRKVVASQSEEEIYAALGLPFIEPELREGRDEIARAVNGKPPPLVRDADLHGILHAHTDLSDGVDTLAAMAQATRKRGYQYFGVADHSKSAHYAGGLSVAEINSQHRAIDKLNKTFGKDFRVFKGIESDILADGSLDYPDDVLDRFDFVVASVHSRFRMEPKEQTQRIVRAVSNPHTTILGHMTGRQLLRRPGYEINIEKILKACAKHGVAIEINANPWRLDLDWRWHGRALELGCMMSINPDAHSTNEIDLTHWGVEMARKGGVPADRVLNCLNLAAFSRHLACRKTSRFPATSKAKARMDELANVQG
jgi:DNA polymerase (family 10)